MTTEAVGESHTLECPQCGGSIVADPKFVAWCASCSWNVDPDPPESEGWWATRVARASERASRRLYDQILEEGTGSAPLLRLAVAILAGAVHLLTVALLVLGLALLGIGLGFPVPMRIIFGGLALLAAFYLQPFRWRHAKPKGLLSRDDAPALFALIDEIAESLGTPAVTRVRINADFNASYSRTRRTGAVMTLGWALWSILDPQERVALVGHELGHQVNGDVRREFPIYSAVVSLYRLSYLLTPWTSPGRTTGLAVVGELVMVVLLSPLMLVAGFLGLLLYVLARRQGIGAEYYADELGARAGGTDAAASLSEKLLIALPCERTLLHTVKFDKTADPWKVLHAFARSIPNHEWERQRQLGRLRLPAIDNSHPPSQLRADLLRAKTHHTAGVVLDSQRSQAIEQELAPYVAAVTKRLRDRFPY